MRKDFKKAFVAVLVVCVLAACNSNSSSTRVQVDSFKKELDTLGQKVENKAEQAWDTTKQKAKDLKENIEAKFDSMKKDRKDTLDK